MPESQIANKPVQLNDEGELIGGVFCAYCGGLNPADAAECVHCQEHIADQGPDLHSRLQRIHRRASSSGGFSDITAGGIGSVTGRSSEKSIAGQSILSIPSRALRAGSFARLTELGAVVSSVFFLLCMVALLTVPSREALFIVLFFATAALSCTIVSFMINIQERKANGSTVSSRSTPDGWDATRFIIHLGAKILDNPRFLTVLATIILFGLVVLVFSLVMLPLAR
jgi:hypothetical protein